MRKLVISVLTVCLFIGSYFALSAEEKEVYGLNTPATIVNAGEEEINITVDGQLYATLQPGEKIQLVGLQPRYHDGLIFDHYSIFINGDAYPLSVEKEIYTDVEVCSAYLKAN